jgi:acetyl esterase/lipase
MKRTLLFLLILTSITFSISCCKKTLPETDKDVPMENIAYGKHIRQVMDISLPANASKDNKVAVVFCIHGGSWSGGDKKDFDWIKQDVNAYNLAYVTLNYRLLRDSVTYIQMLEDIDAAISYLKKNGDSYHLKKDKMCMLGGSAGGHLALLYAYSMASPVEIACVFSQAGPADFLDTGQLSLNGAAMLPLMNQLLGTHVTLNQLYDSGFAFPSAWAKASPVSHVKPDSPPTVLAYGVKDELVSYSNALRLEHALLTQDVAHRLITYPNSGHELNNDPDKNQEYMLALVHFLNTYLLQ